jgi:hypothetical protein
MRSATVYFSNISVLVMAPQRRIQIAGGVTNVDWNEIAGLINPFTVIHHVAKQCQIMTGVRSMLLGLFFDLIFLGSKS